MSCSLAEWLWRPEALSSSPCVDTLRIDSCGEYRRYVEDVTLFNWTMAAIDSVPQAVQVACHNGDAQTNKLTNHDSRVKHFTSPLHNVDNMGAVWSVGKMSAW